MTIQLTPQVELALAAEATRRGTTPDLLAAELITAQLPLACGPKDVASGSGTVREPSSSGSMYDLWKGHFETLPKPAEDAPPTDFSEDTGRRFAEAMVEKHRQGRL